MIIREARKRAGLSQRELAQRLGTTQAVIARWEAGHNSPSFDRVLEAVRACDLDLGIRIFTRDDQHALLIDDALRLSAGQRLDVIARNREAMEDFRASVRRHND